MSTLPQRLKTLFRHWLLEPANRASAPINSRRYSGRHVSVTAAASQRRSSGRVLSPR